MALRMMSAIVTGKNNINDDSQMACNHVTDRVKLQEELLAASKMCHARFGGKAELATDSDVCVIRLCTAFEQIFSHGMKYNKSEKLNTALRHVSEFVSGSPKSNSIAFWPYIKQLLTCHEQERFTVLRKVSNDHGRGRAWLRAALNERSLERHLHSMVNSELLPTFYESWAFLLDQERANTLSNIAAGLTTILFAIRVDNEDLNIITDGSKYSQGKISQEEPVIHSSLPNPSLTHQKCKKKIATSIISFDDDDNDDDDDADNNSNDHTIKEDKLSLDNPLESISISPNLKSQSNTPLSSYTSTLQNVNPNLDTPQVILNVSTISWENGDSLSEQRLLTPVADPGHLGGLVPISPLDSALDDMLISLPNYTEDSEVAEAAEEATEPLMSLHVDPETLDAKALRVRLAAMNEVLDQAREESMSSKLQLARFQRQHQNYLEKHELQIQTLNRENELLRQQLRKYVSAVQMLKNGSESDTFTENSLDYHKESQHFQEKLIQVAQMHDELMEFNNILTKQLTDKDKMIKTLQAELECLRGPLSEEGVSVEPSCLIHIWIPSVFLTGQSSDIHHVYQIYVRIRDTEWNIYRRYAQFYSLCKNLKKHDSVIPSFEFPPKKTIGNKDAKFVEDRRQKLQHWLRRVVGRLSNCSPVFSTCPTKQTLINLMPFFGDLPTNEEQTRNSSLNAYSSSPQYMGL